MRGVIATGDVEPRELVEQARAVAADGRRPIWCTTSRATTPFDWTPSPSDEFAPAPERHAEASAAHRRLRLRHEVEHPAPLHGVRLRRARVPGDDAGVRPAGLESRRRVPQQRPRRSGRARLRDRQRARPRERRRAGVRHLPRPPDSVAGDGRRDLQAEVRPPRRQPSGEGARDRQGRDHVAEPRLRGRSRVAAARRARSRTSICTTAPSKGCATRRSRSSACSTTRRRRPGRTTRTTCSRSSWTRWKSARNAPTRTDLKRILVIGSGPIVIGQACEFDYSGTQACKALRAEGLEVILVNSNPATIMTDPEIADRTYVEPLTPEILEQIIERERPDALLPTVGGQTALNLAVALGEHGTLEKYGVAADRRVDRRHQGRRGPAAVQRRDARDRHRRAREPLRAGRWTRRSPRSTRSASRSSSGRRSRSAASAAASPTTSRSSASWPGAASR